MSEESNGLEEDRKSLLAFNMKKTNKVTKENMEEIWHKIWIDQWIKSKWFPPFTQTPKNQNRSQNGWFLLSPIPQTKSRWFYNENIYISLPPPQKKDCNRWYIIP